MAKYGCRQNCLDKGLLRTKPGFYGKANHKGALFDIASTRNSIVNLIKVFWEYIFRFYFADETYTLPCITTIDSKLWCFHCEILHSTLHLNEKLFLFHKHNTSLCLFCNLEHEEVIHLEWLWCILQWLSPLKQIFIFPDHI